MVPEISTTLQVNRTSPTYGSFTILTYHLNQHLDLHTRAEWFWDKDGAQTRHGAHYGEIAVGHNVVPIRGSISALRYMETLPLFRIRALN